MQTPKDSSFLFFLREILYRLETFIDKFELQSNFFHKEVQKGWEEVKEELYNLKGKINLELQKAKTFKDEEDLHFHLGILELRDIWSSLSKKLYALGLEIKKFCKSGQKLSDLAELKIHLANMELKESLQEKTSEITNNFYKAKNEVKKESEKTLFDLNQSLKSLTNIFFDRTPKEGPHQSSSKTVPSQDEHHYYCH